MAENIAGKDVTLRVYANAVPLIIKAKTIKVEEIGEEVTDGVNGDDRDELQFIPSHYKLTFENFFSEKGVLTALLANRANEDAANPQFVNAMGIRFQFHGGGRAVYTAKEITFSGFTIDVSGRKERVMVPVVARARRFVEGRAM